MKRPVSLLLLLVFTAIQIYFAQVPVSHQVESSTWIEVSPHAGGLVERQQHYYLITVNATYRLQANQVHITAQKHRLTWVDVPEPSGMGVWKLAVGPSAIPLVGLGGPVYPAPNGQSVLWVDPRTRLAYLSQPTVSGLRRLSPELGSVTGALWAPDSQALGLVGQGPQGTGAYLWDRDGNLSAVALPSGQLRIAALGFARNNVLLAALNNGRVLYQGKGLVPLPALSPIYLDKGHADILGETANDVIFWTAGRRLTFLRPDLKWMGQAVFSRNGQIAAVLSQTIGGQWRLLTYTTHQHLEISMPFAKDTRYRLLGFLGDHWILVTVPDGPHMGTYAWWAQGT
ncbi:MAG: hypothetical protein C7B45_07755 [Sulfobacillus acidophilus]|uniref:WD40 repeat domain-containing protein n=1 Tax=Sulfobacillus acidophilus TaxID=53633 RepID=A0A2T2WJ60_9FIRM|nr:MAG: hypothetical protein C7B45_07755 [Sulfobacillus acidophilus]